MPATAVLRQRLLDEIREKGVISFSRFMERALYEPEFGYYSRERNKTGRAGDFFTSVSVGSCFGQLLASQMAEVWDLCDRPEPFHLIEQGANDGCLMADVLDWLQKERPDCFALVQGHFIEPLESLRVLQSSRLPAVKNHEVMPEYIGEHGVFFCNELLDAFPVQRIRWTGGRWCELGVAIDSNDQFLWQEMDFQQGLPFLTEQQSYRSQYTTEVCPGIPPWTKSIASLLTKGVWLITDYGLPGAIYYEPSRTDGTLRGYRNHQMVTDDFLSDPGEMDLTTHVNWTALEESALACGLTHFGTMDQMRFLTALAEPHLKQIESRGIRSTADQAWLRQFQTLSHPSQMGMKFQTMILTKGWESSPPLRGGKFRR